MIVGWYFALAEQLLGTRTDATHGMEHIEGLSTFVLYRVAIRKKIASLSGSSMSKKLRARP